MRTLTNKEIVSLTNKEIDTILSSPNKVYIYIFSFRILPGDQKRGDRARGGGEWGESGHEVFL